MCPLFELIKDVITTGIALFAVYVAYAGLNTWKAQMKGKTDYEIARRYLLATYKVRDGFKILRNPFIPIGEIEKNKIERKTYTRNEEKRIVYNERWKDLLAVVTILNVEILEAEVSWGSEARKVSEKLDKCVREIYEKLHLFLNEDVKNTEDIDLTIYDTGENNLFTIKIEKSIKEIEDYLRRHVK